MPRSFSEGRRGRFRRVPRLARRRTAIGVLALALAGLIPGGCATLSLSQEEELGREAEREIEKEVDFVRDAFVTDYVRDMGERIVTAAGPQPFDYRFYVVENDEINAFALPAGSIYVHTGTILRAADVHELAGVLAHEVGHVVRRHIARNYNKQRNTGIVYEFFSLALSHFVGGYVAKGGRMLGELGAVAVVNSFTRGAEVEADAFAVEVMPKAGYDPNGLVSFFATLRREKGKGGPSFLSSHPATDDRIEHTTGLIAQLPSEPGPWVRDRGRLEIIQRRIEILTGRARP